MLAFLPNALPCRCLLLRGLLRQTLLCLYCPAQPALRQLRLQLHMLHGRHLDAHATSHAEDTGVSYQLSLDALRRRCKTQQKSRRNASSNDTQGCEV